ncbi:mucoidy inhibitor MuiA family protein [Myxococcus sp. K15C18031901]|uniref:mucoidy inhibitor MuiA family protein n=1 Tax=Myxococcus dinghuensis TaxID=2906761 RepID=UPI0020A7B7EB|nr:mucoidy inhibitor MuiA family protein [Myxococcus dinghuensis]MCP3097353.1 mucoidy inhibitor MuiA family protein [Myxococcus dinghuensis]
MLLLGLGLVATSLLQATTEAPITGVTVYSDRARVVRTANVTLSGPQRLELPRLPDGVSPDSVQVEAQGAEVTSVDIRPASPSPFPQEEARKLLATLDRLDDDITRADTERAAFALQMTALRRIRPLAPQDGVLEESSELQRILTSNPASWGTSVAFLVDRLAKLEARRSATEDRMLALQAERRRRLEEAASLGELPRTPGTEVAVSLTGSGPAKVRLSYLVVRDVRWYPRFELQLNPAQQRVQVAFSGRVSQNTGEDWEHARITLSTALPSTATALPRLTTWKIGTVERFIPQPIRKEERVSEPPPLPERPPAPDLELELRRQLLSRAGRPEPTPPPAARTPPRSPTAYAPPTSPPSTRETQNNGGQPSGQSHIIGTLIDAQSRQPMADVVVTATSPSLMGEQTVVSDAQGNYRLHALPSGRYTLRFEKEQYKPYARSDILLRMGRTIRVNVELLTESLGEVVEIMGAPPTIDVGSTTMGVNVDAEFRQRMPGGGGGPSSTGGYYSPSAPEVVVDSFVGLTPPPGWKAPVIASDLPASLAGGYDLAYTAPRAETVPSGQGERTIPLLVESWPVEVQRKVFPALASEAYLVAELKSPSRGVLPGGEAALFVGADPVGTANLKFIVPGEPFTLPLGVDPAVRTARNVRVVQSKEGFISKDEINTYEVTLEVPNPYTFPLKTHVVDQRPLSQDSEVEVKLVRTEPAAKEDPKTGELSWDVVVPPSGKTTLVFEYTVRRPQHWRLSQSP